MEYRVEDYYAILGVDNNATRAVIKKAYRELAKTHHPDKKNIQNKTFGEIQADLDGRRVSEAADFRLVQVAWETLSDEEKRKEYDVELTAYRAEQAKVEKRQARERAKLQRRAEEEARKKKRAAKKEAEAAAREAAIAKMAEMKADQEFLENLYNDFGEDHSIAFELRNLKEMIAAGLSADPELGERVSNPELGMPTRKSLIDDNTRDPELEDITNQQTPGRTVKGRREAEVFCEDPELDPMPRGPSFHYQRAPSPSTANLMAEIERARMMRLSDPRLSDPRLSEERPEALSFQAYEDPVLA